VDDPSQFLRMLADSKIGTTARLDVVRQSRRIVVDVPVTRARAARPRRQG
jgi:hypothetical protein